MAHNLGGLGLSVQPEPKRQRLHSGQDPPGANPFDEAFSDDEDQGKSKAGSKLSTEAKRYQHCEVEKRRRERMNRYMAELAQMIPACNAVPRRLDKLSILKMAVDHMKNLRGDPHSSSDYKPGFLTDDELKQLVVEAANGFMIIIGCSQARVLFVSDAMEEVLKESPEGWIGTCFYDLLHPKDLQKVKEQLSCFDLEEALKASVRQNVSNSPLIMHSQSMNGLRRSFLCRVKRTQQPAVQETQSQQSDMAGRDYNRSEDVIRLLQSTQYSLPHQYAVLHCTGFIRNLTASERHALRVEDSSVEACLVAVARLQHFGESAPRATMDSNENEFVARVAVDGRFTYVDPRVVGVLEYLPQDLVGQVSYEYYHPEDIQKMVQLHHDAMKRHTPMPTVQYRFLSKSQKWVCLAMKAFCFTNPFSQQVEYVVCTNVVIRSGDKQQEGGGVTLQPSAVPSQVEQQLIIAGGGGGGSRPALTQGPADDDPLAGLLPDITGMGQAFPSSAPQPLQPMDTFPTSQPHIQHQAPPIPSTAASSTPHPGTASQPHPNSFIQAEAGPVMSAPTSTTLQENAATAQRILEEYNRINAPPLHRKDLGYNFPPGLFPTQVDLESSQAAYQSLLEGLDNPDDFQRMFNQIEVDPLRPQNVFGDMDFDVFD